MGSSWRWAWLSESRAAADASAGRWRQAVRIASHTARAIPSPAIRNSAALARTSVQKTSVKPSCENHSTSV